MDVASSRTTFARTLAEAAAAGKKAMVLAPLGAGKTHTLGAISRTLEEQSVPFAFVDLFTAASTPERLLAALADAVTPFMKKDVAAIGALVAEATEDRHQSSSALLRLMDLLTTRAPTQPFVWLIDEVTEIRSLAYFPDLGQIDKPFARTMSAARGAVLTSSYLGLAVDLFPDFERHNLPGLGSNDLTQVPSLRSDSGAVTTAISLTRGFAASLLPLVADLRETRDVTRSLIRLLAPGGSLELACRRQYEVLLMRSRGYAVSKRAAEVVAVSRNQRLTDLFPHIGRTAGASRQYLRWLVEVGLLTQIRKRYDFADPTVGLWAGLYLGRGRHPTNAEISEAVELRVAEADRATDVALSDQGEGKDTESEPAVAVEAKVKRVDRFEEID